MRRVVFDIETVGADFESLDPLSKEYFLKFADSPQEIEAAKQSTSFYPLTAQIVALAMVDADTEKGAVYYQNGANRQTGRAERFREDGVLFIPADESEIICHFWRLIASCDQIITFNGRIFDAPFIMLRSAIHRISVIKNLVPYRYSAGFHIDLADQMTFYDAMRRRFSLHIWCKAFGIPSPKEGGVCGHDVRALFQEGRFLEIARYCLADVYATKQLYGCWEKYLKI